GTTCARIDDGFRQKRRAIFESKSNYLKRRPVCLFSRHFYPTQKYRDTVRETPVRLDFGSIFKDDTGCSWLRNRKKLSSSIFVAFPNKLVYKCSKITVSAS